MMKPKVEQEVFVNGQRIEGVIPMAPMNGKRQELITVDQHQRELAQMQHERQQVMAEYNMVGHAMQSCFAPPQVLYRTLENLFDEGTEEIFIREEINLSF